MIHAFPLPEARLLIFDDPEALAREAARRFVAGASRAVDGGGVFRVALSGGRTPLEAYRVLASDPFRYSIHWPSVELFWGDERFVPHDHPDSNYRAAREALLGALPIQAAQVHPIPTDTVSPQAAAVAYQDRLRRLFGVEEGRPVRFDQVLLGLGEDGHTASLFPGALPEAAPETLVAAVERPGDACPRVTLTLNVLNAAREVIFLVSGEAKAAVLERVLRTSRPDPALPATLVQPTRGKVIWLVDRAAAGRVEAADEGRVRQFPAGGGKG